LRIGSGTEAEVGWEVATGLAADLDWADLELFLVVVLVVVDLACACGAGAVAGGTRTGGVAELAGLVAVTAMAPTPAAAAVREELGGEAGDVGLLWTSGVEIVPWAGGVTVVFWTMGVVFGAGWWGSLSGAMVAMRWSSTAFGMGIHRLVHIHGRSYSGWGCSCIGAKSSRGG